MCVVREPDMTSRYYHSELLIDIAYIFGWMVGQARSCVN